jgi:predicted CXXCH cytochrome family protein
MMKKGLILLFTLLFVAMAVSAFAVVANTKHNFTTSGPGAQLTLGGVSVTMCGACHIPHGGIAGAGPLWARNNPVLSTYTVYGAAGPGVQGHTVSSTLVNLPQTMSLACLSCHDGTIGINTTQKNGVTITYNVTITNANPYVASNGLLTTAVDGSTGYAPNVTQDLRNDHPISLQYRGTAATFAGLENAVNNYVNGTTFPLFAISGGVGDQMECGSCHNPHDNTNPPLLRAPKATICQGCHSLM